MSCGTVIGRKRVDKVILSIRYWHGAITLNTEVTLQLKLILNVRKRGKKMILEGVMRNDSPPDLKLV